MPIPSWITGTGTGLTEPTVIAYSETQGYPMESPVTGSVTLRTKWAERNALMDNILGNYLPWPYGGPPMFAINGNIVTVPQSKVIQDGEGNAYEHALLNVNFGWVEGGGEGSGPGGGTSEGVFYETIEPNGEFATLPHKSASGNYLFFYAASPGTPESGSAVEAENTPGKLVLGFDWSLKWLRLDFIPSVVMTLYNSVNNAPVVSPTFGMIFAAETLMLSSTNVNRTFSTDGSVKQSLDLRFSWKPNGWNKVWRPDTQAWVPIYRRSGSPPYPEYKNYPPQSFSPLLPPP